MRVIFRKSQAIHRAQKKRLYARGDRSAFLADVLFDTKVRAIRSRAGIEALPKVMPQSRSRTKSGGSRYVINAAGGLLQELPGACKPSNNADFVLLDVRSPQSYAAGHVPGAVSLPHARITTRNLAPFPEDTLFVVYCNGPHCNGADRAALNLAKLGRRVKKMIGGVEGWKDEGFSLTSA